MEKMTQKKAMEITIAAIEGKEIVSDEIISKLKDILTALDKKSKSVSKKKTEENAELLASFKQLVQLQDYNTAFMELESGAADAIAMDIGVAKYQIQGKESEYTILDEPIQSEQYAIGFYLGNTELRDKVQAELDKMAADGTFAKISENWFGYDVCILGE